MHNHAQSRTITHSHPQAPYSPTITPHSPTFAHMTLQRNCGQFSTFSKFSNPPILQSIQSIQSIHILRNLQSISIHTLKISTFSKFSPLCKFSTLSTFHRHSPTFPTFPSSCCQSSAGLGPARPQRAAPASTGPHAGGVVLWFVVPHNRACISRVPALCSSQSAFIFLKHRVLACFGASEHAFGLLVMFAVSFFSFCWSVELAFHTCCSVWRPESSRCFPPCCNFHVVISLKFSPTRSLRLLPQTHQSLDAFSRAVL